jgi:hypothetical protein
MELDFQWEYVYFELPNFWHLTEENCYFFQKLYFKTALE